MSRYAGKKAVVVGGTHGMGLAVAKALLAGGAEVLVTGRDEKKVESARDELSGAAAHVVRSDATSMADIDALGRTVRAEFGRVDLVHYNVGVSALESFERVTEASYDQSFAVNTKGAFFTVQRLAPLIEHGGSVVFTSSVADTGGMAEFVVYSGAKAAVVAMAKSIASALLPRRIRVNVVSPGFVDTPSMGVSGLSAEERAAFMALGDAATPMRRHGTVEEVAAAVLFFAFEATFTTGARLTVDGGIGQDLAYPE